VTDQLAEAGQRVVADAHDGRFCFGTDVGSWLVRLNAWHPGSAKWESLLQLLADDLPASGKRESLYFLESLADHVPPGVRGRLIPIATGIAHRVAPEAYDVLFDNRGDAAGAAANLLLALGAVDPYQSADRLVALLGGDPADRRWAARVAARTEGQERLGLLVTLAADADPRVRAQPPKASPRPSPPPTSGPSPSVPSWNASPTPARSSPPTPPTPSEWPEEKPPRPSSLRCANTPRRTSGKPQ
jgi:hypothetical protein